MDVPVKATSASSMAKAICPNMAKSGFWRASFWAERAILKQKKRVRQYRNNPGKPSSQDTCVKVLCVSCQAFQFARPLVSEEKFALATENIPGPTPSKGCRRVNCKLEYKSSFRSPMESMADCSESDNRIWPEERNMVLYRSRALRVDQAIEKTARIMATMPTAAFWLEGNGQK